MAKKRARSSKPSRTRAGARSKAKAGRKASADQKDKARQKAKTAAQRTKRARPKSGASRRKATVTGPETGQSVTGADDTHGFAAWRAPGFVAPTRLGSRLPSTITVTRF